MAFDSHEGETMGDIDSLRRDIAELQRWRGEVERSLGRQNGLRTGLEREVEGLREQVADMRAWLDEKFDELRRDQLEIRNQLANVVQSVNSRLMEIEKPLWGTIGKVGILAALVLALISLFLK